MNSTFFLRVKLLSIVLLFVSITACKNTSSESSVTGWAYNDPKNGGFEKVDFREQETGPGLVFIEGGAFTMGRAQDDPTFEWNNKSKRVTVSSFYIDKTEVSNLHYLEYLYWTKKVFGTTFPDIYVKALPDTLVWREKTSYNEPYVDYYLRHSSYRDYPVVGVSWLQANEFCAWRTDRVNEYILIRDGFLEPNPSPTDQNYFSTEAYTVRKWQGQLKTKVKTFDPQNPERDVIMQDGILLPKYRLPSEVEWEFAAYGLIGNMTDGEIIKSKRIYPWNGNGVRNGTDAELGKMMANFVKGKGDYMGVAGYLNDGADATNKVESYYPNDYGLYNMAGNVSEWVMDVYRATSSSDVDEFRPFRGNVYVTQSRDSTDGSIEIIGEPTFQKFTHKVNIPTAHGVSQDAAEVTDSILTLITRDKNGTTPPDGNVMIPGRIKWREVSNAIASDNLEERINYKTSDNISNLDGDVLSSIYFGEGENAYADRSGKLMYEYGKTTLVNDQSRVYKGGSWRDRAFWLSPGSRRFLNQRQSTSNIGFRCAMTRVGTISGNGK